MGLQDALSGVCNVEQLRNAFRERVLVPLARVASFQFMVMLDGLLSEVFGSAESVEAAVLATGAPLAALMQARGLLLQGGPIIEGLTTIIRVY